ncbi:MAG TPA: hypothetical protein VLK65_08530 [Vicinamibacteria bacterium]|nr:hypothetical protein [Vicinamibacteria bacterium]
MKGTTLSIPPPFVHIGPDIERERLGEWGVLLGRRRYRWIDVFVLRLSLSHKLKDVVEERYGQHELWDPVGISIPSREAARRSTTLLDALVPGDLLITEKRLAFHAGARWAATRRRP